MDRRQRCGHAAADARRAAQEHAAPRGRKQRTSRCAAPCAGQAAAALKTATDTLGATGKLTPAGERATLTLTNASGEQIKRWLVDARTTARARTIEAKLHRSGAGYSGTVVVLPAAN